MGFFFFLHLFGGSSYRNFLLWKEILINQQTVSEWFPAFDTICNSYVTIYEHHGFPSRILIPSHVDVELVSTLLTLPFSIINIFGSSLAGTDRTRQFWSRPLPKLHIDSPPTFFFVASCIANIIVPLPSIPFHLSSPPQPSSVSPNFDASVNLFLFNTITILLISPCNQNLQANCILSSDVYMHML